jgi:anti-sigma B factor antagonist
VLNFSLSNEGDVAVVYIVGELDASGADDFSKALQEVVRDGSAYIIVNMTEVSYVSSNGLKPLLTWPAATKASSGKRQLALCNLQEFVREVFRVTEFDRKFPIYDSEDQAINAFRKRV